MKETTLAPKTYIGTSYFAYGPENIIYHLDKDIVELNQRFMKHTTGLLGTGYRPYFALEIGGAFKDFQLGLGSATLFADGSVRVIIKIDCKTVHLSKYPRRVVLAGLLVEASEKIAKRLKRQDSELDVSDYLVIVNEVTQQFAQAPYGPGDVA